GEYEIRINGQTLPKTFSNFTLGRKIELQGQPETPQYQQASRVADLVKERFEKALVPYRDLQAKMKSRRREFGNEAPEVAAFRKTIQPQLDELLALAEEYTEKIYSAAQPVAHRYEIRKVD
ncbi:MAG: hypothetical protein KJT03_15970, partial [Verrucomicrobiae bacterium]|nr:hypothetical protein [Verrucomicrobiae bacterium]